MSDESRLTNHRDADLNLPPRPDPETGLPAPPHAAGYHGPEQPTTVLRAKHVVPPSGAGPILVSYRTPRRVGILHFVATFGMCTALFALFSLTWGAGLSWLTYWPITGIILGASYLASPPLAYIIITAGADWVAWTMNNRWWTPWTPRPHFIKVYELTTIVSFSPKWSGVYLRLRDADGRELRQSLKTLQGDRRAWDLLANGVLHSVAHGATINHDAVNVFWLASHPATRGANII